MKLEKESYRQTFSQLKASPELRKELLAMTENKEKSRKPKKFVLRRLAVAAAVMALAFALAMGANAATGGELYEATIGRVIYTFTMEDGGKAEIFANDDGSFTVIERRDDVEGENSESDEDVVYEQSNEVETDEDGHTVYCLPSDAMDSFVSSAPQE